MKDEIINRHWHIVADGDLPKPSETDVILIYNGQIQFSLYLPKWGFTPIYIFDKDGKRHIFDNVKYWMEIPDIPESQENNFIEKKAEESLVDEYIKIYGLPRDIIEQGFRFFPREGSNIELYRNMKERRAYFRGYRDADKRITAARAKEIVKMADRLLEAAQDNLWTSDEYYEHVAKAINNEQD